MIFSIIVAMDANRGIGKDGKLSWQLPSDMRHFKEITISARPGLHNAVIMGRKTWESIPERFRPLPQRLNVVLTQNHEIVLPTGCLRCSTFQEAWEKLGKDKQVDQVFVIGGASVYKQAIGLSGCQRIYVTRLQEIFECDAFFPEIPQDFYKITEKSVIFENNCHFSFQEFHRKAP